MIERVRFQADADLNIAIVEGLIRAQPAIDMQTALQANFVKVPDAEVLRRSAEQGRILISHDTSTMPIHFTALLAAGQHSPGVFLIRQQVPISEAIDALLLVWEASEPDEWIDLITFLP